MKLTGRQLVLSFLSFTFLAAEPGPSRLVLVAGGGNGSAGVKATAAKLNGPFGAEFDREGNLYIIEMPGNRLGKVDAKGVFTVVAGSGKKGSGGDGGPASAAEFNGPHNLAITANGDLYIADTFNNRIRKIDARSKIITTFAGTGENGFSGDGGPADKAKFSAIHCIALDPQGTKLYLADLDNRRIRVIDIKSGIVNTVAGNGTKGVPMDGAEAARAPLVDPRAVAADERGNVYVLERSGHALRVVDAAGKIRTVAGTGKQGASGDGGDARQATFNGPKHLCIDRDGGILIVDTENHKIRKYLPATGKVVSIAGNGKKGKAGLGGPPEKAELAQPHGVYLHASGDLYISDSSNNRVVRVERGK